MKHYSKLLICSFLILMLAMTSARVFSQGCFTTPILSPTGAVCGTSVTITLANTQDQHHHYQLQINGSNYGIAISGDNGVYPINLATVTSSSIGGSGNMVVVESIDDGSCSSNQVAFGSIQFTPNPAGTITADNSVICGLYPSTLTINPSVPNNNYTYNWFFNSNPITGANAATYSTSVAGTYTASITSNCGTTTLNGVTLTASPGVGTLTSITGSPTLPANTATSTYHASAPNASGYTWTITPSNAGTISGSSTTGTVT